MVMQVSDAAIRISTGDIDPEHLRGAQIMLGDVELGRFDGQSSVTYDIPAGRHVLIIREGVGWVTATKLVVRHGYCANLHLARRDDPDGVGISLIGAHVLRRDGQEPIAESDEPGAELLPHDVV
ncbi:hypothetical protein DXX98_04485 [Janibacter melonis]|nr:hypothetical protein [Janibacter melonis]